MNIINDKSFYDLNKKIKSGDQKYITAFHSQSIDDLVALYESESDGGKLFSDKALDSYIYDKGDFESLNLCMSDTEPRETDIINIKTVYSSLKGLSDSMASDARIWTSLCLHFWKYCHYRWKISDNNAKVDICTHYFFNVRPYTRNSIARLWWIGRLTYDDAADGNDVLAWRYTEFVCRNARFIVDILERSPSNNKQILKLFIDTMIKIESEYKYSISTELMRQLQKYLCLLGGARMLDCTPEEIIKGCLENRVSKLLKIKR